MRRRHVIVEIGKAFDAAVTKYVATVVQLKDVTPSSLHPDLDRLIAAVHQERFDDAADARASLDEYALSACGRALPTLPTVSSSSVPSTTTVPPT